MVLRIERERVMLRSNIEHGRGIHVLRNEEILLREEGNCSRHPTNYGTN